MEVSEIVKCSRCGVEFNPAKARGCVDVVVKHKTDGLLGFEFDVQNHGSSTEKPLATLCLNCLGEWLLEVGFSDGKAKEIVEMYKIQKEVEGNYGVG